MGNKISNNKTNNEKIYTKRFVYHHYDSINNLSNLPNDLEELIMNYLTVDLTNLPPSLERIIINVSGEEKYYLEQELSKNNIMCNKVQIKVPYGCQIYSKDKNNNLKLINNFCGFVELEIIVHYIHGSSLTFLNY